MQTPKVLHVLPLPFSPWMMMVCFPTPHAPSIIFEYMNRGLPPPLWGPCCSSYFLFLSITILCFWKITFDADSCYILNYIRALCFSETDWLIVMYKEDGFERQGRDHLSKQQSNKWDCLPWAQGKKMISEKTAPCFTWKDKIRRKGRTVLQ